MDLPPELILKIFSKFDLVEVLIVLPHVCPLFRELALKKQNRMFKYMDIGAVGDLWFSCMEQYRKRRADMLRENDLSTLK